MSDDMKVQGSGVVASALLDPNVNVQPGSTDATTPPPVLPSPNPRPTDLNVGAELAKIMIELGFERRKVAKKERDNAEAAIQVANRAELKEMQIAADLKYDIAIQKGWAQVGNGVVGMGSALCSFAGYKQGLTVYENGAKQFNEGGITLLTASDDKQASEADIRAKQAEQAGKTADRINGDVMDDQRAIRESIRKAIDLYRDYVNGVTASQQAAIHRS
jgi:hypothetical protein